MELVRYFGRAVGRVQGVGFRFFVEGLADERGITGWVKNMSDGSVTMELQGTEEQIQDIANEIRRGNGFCKVRTFELNKRSTIEPDDRGFKILH